MTTVRIIVSILIILHLFLYWRKLRNKTGLIMDLWLSSMVTSNIVFYFLLYLPSKSELNIYAVGDAIYSIRHYVDNAFDLSVIGYICLWLGKYIADNYRGKSRFLFMYKPITKLIISHQIRIIYIMFFMPIIVGIVFISIKNGGLFSDVRMLSGTSSSFRMLYNIGMSIIPIFMCMYGCMYLQYHKKKYLIALFVVFVLSLFLSMRGVSFGAIVSLFIMYAIHKRRKMSIGKIFLFGAIIMVLVSLMGILRNGNVAQSLMSIAGDMMYGNTFSDLRDFAWILSGWDETLLWGKTYVAGLLSFVPSSVWDFREEWGFGRITLHIAGIDVESFHGGLRGTIFCESFLNFGYFGLIVISTFIGFINETVNRIAVPYIIKGNFVRGYAVSLSTMIYSWLSVSSATFSIYVIFVPLLLCLFLIHVTKTIQVI